MRLPALIVASSGSGALCLGPSGRHQATQLSASAGPWSIWWPFDRRVWPYAYSHCHLGFNWHRCFCTKLNATWFIHQVHVEANKTSYWAAMGWGAGRQCFGLTCVYSAPGTGGTNRRCPLFDHLRRGRGARRPAAEAGQAPGEGGAGARGAGERARAGPLGLGCWIPRSRNGNGNPISHQQPISGGGGAGGGGGGRAGGAQPRSGVPRGPQCSARFTRIRHYWHCPSRMHKK
jgi:hypothetical protein